MSRFAFGKVKPGEFLFDSATAPIWINVLFTRSRLVVFAGDVTPVEIMCHLPAVCEERNIPYCYTPSRKDLGAAMGVKRGTVAMLIREHPEYQDLYDKLKVELSTLPIPS